MDKMIFLCEVLGRKLKDGRKIRDFAIDPLEESDYPSIRCVLLNDGKFYAWCAGHQPGEPLEPEEGWALLSRDVLDEMVLDLKNRRGRRANDLILKEDGQSWRVQAVDTGLRALLRRLTRGRWCRGSDENWLDWKYIEYLRGQPDLVAEKDRFRGKISRLPPGDIAVLTDAVSYLNAAELLMLLDESTATSVFQSLPPLRQMQIFDELSPDRRLALLNLMSPDLACELLARLGQERTEQLLPELELEARLRLLKLLRFPPHLASGRMTNDLLALPEQTSVEQGRQAFTRRPPRFSHYIYLLNERQELVGMLTASQLIAAPDPKLPLSQIATTYIKAIPADQPARVAAYEVLRSQMAALPVVGNQGELLGALTVDLALDVVLPPSLGSQMPRIFA
ncbi:MAG: hypothetical protein U0931_21125 [Vulcanimicrobiota bacterium]